VPVVAADVSGLRTAVGEGGILVAGHEPADHAEALVRLLTVPGMAARFSRRGLRHAAGYSWDRTTDRLLSVYGELVPSLHESRSIVAR
jgi:D-inositol-3-phosphate glycosyltransferase